MYSRILFFLIFTCCYLTAQEENLESSAIVKDSFPVRLSKEEEQMKASQKGCCPAPRADGEQPACCKPASMNCPPLMPYCDPCDCIIDYYNPLIFSGGDLSVEFLFWKVQQKASTFVLTPDNIQQPFPPSTVADAIGKYKSASFDWSPGFRVGLGYTFERDAWRLGALYTFYYADGSDQATRPTDTTLYLEPTNREISNSSNGVDRMKSSTSFHYQTGDLLLSRRYLPGCQILFNLFTGATGAWIHEKWTVTGTDIIGANPNVTTKTDNTWKFKGGGIRFGVDANWHMGAGFGLFNKLSFAALAGSYQNRRVTSITPAGINGTLTPNIRNTTEHETWVVPQSQLEFGLDWNHRFRCWAMSLMAAFEINTWYDLHQLHQDNGGLQTPNSNFLDIRNASDVKLWGFSASANFSF